ncbi:MAG: potassium/proton antiporter [Deltaproteobacteria bacterium]
MDYSVEYILLGASVLVLASIFASKAASKLRVPALLLFLIVGMLAGSEGPGGIYYDDPWSAQLLGVLALAFIIFSGGLHSGWKNVSPVLWSGVSLSTIGVFLTAVLVGAFAHYFLGFSVLMALLLGSIVSSTDAAAVFSVMSSSGAGLRGKLNELLEFESASNDPMAVILTIGFIQLIINPESSVLSMAVLLVKQMVLGILFGYGMGKAMVYIVNRLRLDFEGLYPVLSMSLVLFTYGVTASIGGSGFLAVYIAGLLMGGREFVNKKSLTRFHDGIAWLLQITMFLILGLLVFPSGLLPVVLPGIVVSIFLIFIARPAGVFISLSLSGISAREKTFISWVGLRGAVPVVLATFPLLAGVPESNRLFNLVFFIVITSVLLQGTTIPLVSRWLGVDAPGEAPQKRNVEFEFPYEENTDTVEYDVPDGSEAVGKQIVELGLPESALIMLIKRGGGSIVPRGATVLESGDRVLIMADKGDLVAVRSILGI